MKCEEKGIKPDSQRGGGGGATGGAAAGKNRFNAFKMLVRNHIALSLHIAYFGFTIQYL